MGEWTQCTLTWSQVSHSFWEENTRTLACCAQEDSPPSVAQILPTGLVAGRHSARHIPLELGLPRRRFALLLELFLARLALRERPSGFGEESDALAQIYDMGGGTWSMEACVNVLKALPAEIAEKHISAWVGYCVDALVNDYEQYSAPQIDDDQALASPAASPLQEPQEPVRSFSSGHDQLGGATSAGQQSFAGQPKTPIKTSIMPGQNPVNVLAESGRTAVGESEQRLQLELEKKATVRRPPVHRRDPALKMPRLLAGVCAGEGGLDAQTQPGAAGEAAQEGEAEGAQAHARQARLGPARSQRVPPPPPSRPSPPVAGASV